MAISFHRTVDVHIAKLRKKLEDNPEDPRYILTVHAGDASFPLGDDAGAVAFAELRDHLRPL